MNYNLIKQFISNLLEERDFLCWQLSEAYGLIDKKAFNDIEDKHFESYDIKSQDQLNSEAEELIKILDGERIDSDTISIILKCSLDKSEKTLDYLTIKHREMISELNKYEEDKLAKEKEERRKKFFELSKKFASST